MSVTRRGWFASLLAMIPLPFATARETETDDDDGIVYYGQEATDLLHRSFCDWEFSENERDRHETEVPELTEDGELSIEFRHFDARRNYRLVLDFARGRVVRYSCGIEDWDGDVTSPGYREGRAEDRGDGQ